MMAEKRRNGVLSAFSSVWRNHSYILVFLLILVVYAITIQANGRTFTPGHVSSILSSQNTVIVGTMAIGMALVIITGQIDLSIGSALVLCTGITIIVFNVTENVFLTVLAALGSGLVLGAVNGVLAAYARIPPFIVTLGTMLIYRSLALYAVRTIPPSITGSSSSQFAMKAGSPSYDWMRMQFGTGSLRIAGFSIPFVSILFLACLVLFVFIAHNTKYGKAVFAVGSNDKAVGP